MPNPYTVLGVDKKADADVIRKAYKRLARKYHPDRNKSPDAEDRFKEVNAAYDVIGDAGKRQLFDEFGDASLRAGFDPQQARAWQNMGGRGGPGVGYDFGGGIDVDDLLGSLFGAGGARGRRPRRGADQQTEITIDFLTTVMGGEQPIQIGRPDGSSQRLVVPIPAGAKHGGRVRLKGQGLPPPGGGPAGDLLIGLRVRPHPFLRRDGNDLEMDVPLTVHEAMAGATITVPTPTGDVNVHVPAGAKSGARLRLKGKGVQTRTPGHLYLILRPTVPTSDDPGALEAARTLEAAYGGDVRAALRL